ncbi:mitochondrial S-adenosylmethionine carrier protein-like isoform X2 [Liolophura sinensis]|uniref:mitochondrial S-adenosylmethionine carrier protein-like isoform X2 n=1 Tax=Liolophura sinensis TaxID=3198878 RepID=UPI003158E5EF
MPVCFTTLMAGGLAGTTVDVSLFPLDTLKTRLQSAKGFRRAGGFKGVYSGLASAALGSAPTAALFFCTYEFIKASLPHGADPTGSGQVMVHVAAASLGEVAACLVRVPVEVVKQRTQATHASSSLNTLRKTLASEGAFGLYRGYFSTVCREVPFSFLQFPMWEYFKRKWSDTQGHPVLPWQSSVCGAVSGGLAAGITTPLDVAKTRIMLAKQESNIATGSIMFALQSVYQARGFRGLFAGIIPRTVWISLGGAIFLGVYDKSKLVIHQVVYKDSMDAPR